MRSCVGSIFNCKQIIGKMGLEIGGKVLGEVAYVLEGSSFENSPR